MCKTRVSKNMVLAADTETHRGIHGDPKGRNFLQPGASLV